MKLHWVECVACTKPIPKPRISKWRWKKIYESDYVNFWICENDLHEQFVQEAMIAFGKTLEQVVQLGTHPKILFPRKVTETISNVGSS
jgi:hypothetical protein